jgi:hypothetical protein
MAGVYQEMVLVGIEPPTSNGLTIVFVFSGFFAGFHAKLRSIFSRPRRR